VFDHIHWETDHETFHLKHVCHPGFSLEAKYGVMDGNISLRIFENTWWHFKKVHDETE